MRRVVDDLCESVSSLPTSKELLRPCCHCHPRDRGPVLELVEIRERRGNAQGRRICLLEEGEMGTDAQAGSIPLLPTRSPRIAHRNIHRQ